MEDDKVIVPQSSLAKQVFALVRYTMTAVGGYVLGRGLVDQDTFALIVVIGGTVIPGAWGIYETWHNNEQKKSMASKLPNEDAEIKQ